MNMRRDVAMVVLAGLVVAARVAQASIIVAQTTWNDGTTEGWTDAQSWVTLSNPGSGGIADTGYLHVHMDATSTSEGEPGAEWYALASAPASSVFAGNWQGRWVEFDFLAADVQPEYVQIRWQSATNTTVWRSTVFDASTSSMAVGSWTHMVSSGFADYADWDYGSGTQELFVNDLATIDWIGVYVWRNGAGEQDYGIDEFRLMVPEPGEYMMLATAVLSAVWSFRRKRKAATVAA
jgi:hypothetical protein